MKEKTFVFEDPYDIVIFHDFMHRANIKLKKVVIQYEEMR